MVYVITVTCMYSLQPPSERLLRFGGKGDVIGGNVLSKMKKGSNKICLAAKKVGCSSFYPINTLPRESYPCLITQGR